MLATLVLAAALTGAPPPPTVVYVVRHAEKGRDRGDGDPGLTPAGRRRAEALVRTLADAPISLVLSTKYRRNLETAAPLARARGLEPELVDAADHAGLAARLRALPVGSQVLVVGHSNTVPAIVTALGGPEAAELDDLAYDDLYVVGLGADGGAAVARLHVGPPNPRTPPQGRPRPPPRPKRAPAKAEPRR